MNFKKSDLKSVFIKATEDMVAWYGLIAPNSPQDRGDLYKQFASMAVDTINALCLIVAHKKEARTPADVFEKLETTREAIDEFTAAWKQLVVLHGPDTDNEEIELRQIAADTLINHFKSMMP